MPSLDFRHFPKSIDLSGVVPKLGKWSVLRMYRVRLKFCYDEACAHHLHEKQGARLFPKRYWKEEIDRHDLWDFLRQRWCGLENMKAKTQWVQLMPDEFALGQLREYVVVSIRVDRRRGGGVR
jgi:hypothetical protein